MLSPQEFYKTPHGGAFLSLITQLTSNFGSYLFDPATMLTCSRGLHPRVARAHVQGSAVRAELRTLTIEW